MAELETFWAHILSGEPAHIHAAWENLDDEERATVLAHLETMVTEEGWSEPQRRAAQAALDMLRGDTNA